MSTIELSTLAKIIEANEGLTVTETEDGILISNIDEGQNVPADLVNFVKVYEKETNITSNGKGYVITTTQFSGQTFMMLLMSVYGAEYDIEVTGPFEVKVTPKSKKGVREELEDKETKEVDFVELAEAIDSEDLEIEIHEDGLKVMGLYKKAIAEKIDSLNPTLNIEITDDFILVSEGV